MSQSGDSDPETEPDILELYVGMTYSQALKMKADKKDWEGVLVTTAAALGSLGSVPFVGVAMKAIAKIGETYDGMKRHKKQIQGILGKIHDLRGYLSRLHGKLPHDAALLRRTAEVLLGGMIVIHFIQKPFDGPRPLYR